MKTWKYSQSLKMTYFCHLTLKRLHLWKHVHVERKFSSEDKLSLMV